MAILALEDGRIFQGRAFGAQGVICGEVVFNTGMTATRDLD
jgi:carbamoyl-phosphate synthase small subunit